MEVPEPTLVATALDVLTMRYCHARKDPAQAVPEDTDLCRTAPARNTSPSAGSRAPHRGLVHGFLVLSTMDGNRLAQGDLNLVAVNDRVTNRLVFRFKDGSVPR